MILGHNILKYCESVHTQVKFICTSIPDAYASFCPVIFLSRLIYFRYVAVSVFYSAAQR